MKALVKKYPKEGLWLEDVPPPVCGPGEVAIRPKKQLFAEPISIFINGMIGQKKTSLYH